MDLQPTGFLLPKWNAVRRSVRLALEPLAGVISVGLELYPAADVIGQPPAGADWCVMPPDDGNVDVPIDVGTNSVPLITAQMNATGPGGGTPMAEALRRAYQYFLTRLPVEGDPGDRYVLLTTDGGPNCDAGITCDLTACVPNLEALDPQCTAARNCCTGNPLGCVDDQAVLTQIAALRSIGVKTIVVGIPGSENFAAYLDEFAVAGGQVDPNGTHSYYEVTLAAGTQGLDAVFRDITMNLIRDCQILLEQVPTDVAKVNVAVDCTVIGKGNGTGAAGAAGAPATSGWTYDDPTAPSSITLSGPICDQIRTTGAQRVDVVFGCQTLY
jgi:hypothetical protein